jgi:pimeloyl-ACP methyl ester carboxylesterase
VIAFIHPNPLDQSCWLFQMTHFSTWFRCMAIDIPGYGKSLTAKAGMTLGDIGAACWEAIDDSFPGEPAILVGCSVGAQVLPYMSKQAPKRTRALVMTGVGYNPKKDYATRMSDAYSQGGIDYRRDHALHGMSSGFRDTQLGQYLTDIFIERNQWIDVPTILHQCDAHRMPDPDDLHSAISCPSIIITGTEDGSHPTSFILQTRIAGCELLVIPKGGHTLQFEQPWLFDRLMLDFLRRHQLFPER